MARQVYAIHALPLGRYRRIALPLLHSHIRCARMVHWYVSWLPHSRHRAKRSMQSHTPSASTYSTYFWPSCSQNSIRPTRLWTMRWRMAQQGDCPRNKTKNSVRSSEDYPSSSSGIQAQGRSPLVSSAPGSLFSTCPSSGRSWSCTG